MGNTTKQELIPNQNGIVDLLVGASLKRMDLVG